MKSVAQLPMSVLLFKVSSSFLLKPEYKSEILAFNPTNKN